MPSKISSFYPIYNDLNGSPLSDGSIYIGAAGKNPQVPANQISVYWDAALTIPAAQPIKTINGYPSRSGSPAAFYTSEAKYSLTVLNKNGSQVWTELNAFDDGTQLRNDLASTAVDDGTKGYNLVYYPPKTGEVGVVNYQYEYGDVRRYGAVGDGVTDDTVAIQNAIDSGAPIYIDKKLVVAITSISTSVDIYGTGTVRLLATTNESGVVASSNITIKDLSFDLTNPGIAKKCIDIGATTGVKVDGCKFTGAGTETSNEYGIWGDNAKDYSIVNNHYTDMVAECVRCAAADGGNIENNRFNRIEKISVFLNRCIIIGGSTNTKINNNIFEDVGTLGALNVNDVCCIDVGNTRNTIVNGNLATNVHSFIDIETSTGTPHRLAIVGNTIEGLRLVTPGAEGKGLWINYATTASNSVLFSGNTISYFKQGVTVTSSYNMSISGNYVANCDIGLDVASSRAAAIVGNTIDTNTTGISIYQLAGYGGAIISGNVFKGNTTTITTSFVGTSTEEDKVVVSSNMLEGGLLSYGATVDIKEFGNTYKDSAITISDGNATPTIVGTEQVNTGNTVATTITSFDVPYGETKTVVVNDINTTIDFASTLLSGNGGISYTAKNGDVLQIKRMFDTGKCAVNIIS